MKILNVFYSFKQGGVERLGIAIANQLANYRDVESDVCIISKEYSEELLSEFSKTVKVFKLESKRKLRKLQYVRQLIRIIKENEIDVVHVHQGNLMPFFLLIKTACPDVTFYFTVHDTYIFSSDLNEMDRKIANLICKRIIAISDGVVKDIRSCGIKKEKIKRIYNGINFDKFKMVERKDRKEPFKIINVARFYPQKKGQDVLIKATAILKERGYRNQRQMNALINIEHNGILNNSYLDYNNVVDLEHHSKPIRFIYYLLFDRITFKRRMKEIFKNHKGILAVGKRFYAVGRGAKNNIYKGVHKIKGGHKSEK